jgi:cytochrome c oxidase assembly protein subunit 11
VTGYGGTPNTEAVSAPAEVSDTVVTVKFDANVDPDLLWRFKPVQRKLEIRLGEELLAHYTARNTSDTPITGTATFSVTPYKAAPYFSKIDCFCFTEQTLLPGQEVDMPVLFYVDPAIAEDRNTKDVKLITLSYTFFRADDKETDGNGAKVAKARGEDREGG